MPVLVYSLLRILLIVIAGAGLYLAGVRGLLLVVVAVLVGAALSYLVLDKYRQASGQWLQSRGKGHTKMEDRLEEDADAEDALLDEQEEQMHHDRPNTTDDGADRATTPDHAASRDSDGEGHHVDTAGGSDAAVSDSDGQRDGKADSDQ